MQLEERGVEIAIGEMNPLCKRRVVRAVAGVLACAALIFAAWVWRGDWPEPVAERLPRKADLMVVLGGGAMERPREALRLYQRGDVPKILITGDGGIWVTVLKGEGVPPWKMVHEDEAHSTWENALYAGKMPVFQEAHDIVIVTTWFHGPRALAVFRKQFPQKSFSVAAEPLIMPLNQWQIGYRRRERFAIIYYGLRYGVWP